MKMNNIRDWGYAQGKTFAEKCMSRAAQKYLEARKQQAAVAREDYKGKLLLGTTIFTGFLAVLLVALIGAKAFGVELRF